MQSPRRALTLDTDERIPAENAGGSMNPDELRQLQKRRQQLRQLMTQSLAELVELWRQEVDEINEQLILYRVQEGEEACLDV